jgi:hypothetical protein
MATLFREDAWVRVPTRATSPWVYFGRFVRHPVRTWAQLLADPARLRYGFVAVLVVGVGYGITEGGIALSGGMPSTPWLAIPPGDYFKWEALFSAPVTVLSWILAAGVIHLLSKLVGGHGTFDDTLALLGFAVAVPTLISLVPDAVRAALTTAGLINRTAWEQAVSEPGTADFLFLWAYMIAYVLGLLCLFPVASATAQRLRRWPAVVVGILGALVYQGVYLIFIR